MSAFGILIYNGRLCEIAIDFQLLGKVLPTAPSSNNYFQERSHPLSTYAKFSEKLAFLTP